MVGILAEPRELASSQLEREKPKRERAMSRAKRLRWDIWGAIGVILVIGEGARRGGAGVEVAPAPSIVAERYCHRRVQTGGAQAA
jgi:hypothetical protein